MAATGAVKYVNREGKVQAAAIRWMVENWDYRELISDQAAAGHRMDSIGFLQGHLISIEVKKTINGDMIWNDESRSGMIEPKISSTLRSLYSGETSGQAGVIQKHWNRTQPPLVGILAERFSHFGMFELATMLRARSVEWCFNYQVLQWTGGRVVVIGSCTDAVSPQDGAWDQVPVPALVCKTNRREPPALKQIHALATHRGIGALFNSSVEAALQRGFRIERRPSGVAFSMPARMKMTGTVLALFVSNSDACQGMNVGIGLDGSSIDPEDVPGVQAPRVGYLNTNRFLNCVEDFEKVLDLMLHG